MDTGQSVYPRWINQPIFISSTFLDMQAERDFLRDVVFPELEEKLKPHRIALEMIDLRWGVDTLSIEEDRLKELQILKVCLDEIDRSRPFILAFIGNRYGWIPPESRVKEITSTKKYSPDSFQKSMTALEMEYALLHTTANPVGCFFYFRSLQDLHQIPTREQSRYSDESQLALLNVTRRQLLETLKSEIRKHVPGSRVFGYRFHVADLDQQRADLEELKKIILEHVYNELLHVHQRTSNRLHTTWHSDEALLMDTIVMEKSRVFEGRNELLHMLNQMSSAIPAAKHRLFCIAGGPGSGKSALMAKFIASNQDTSIVKLIHFAGIGPRTGSVENMLERWIYELTPADEREAVMAEISGMSYPEIRKRFHEVLFRRSKSKPVLILVDALDQFERSNEARYLTWIPEEIPAHIMIMATSITGEETEAITKHGSGTLFPLRPLTRDEAIQIMNSICLRHHKSTLHDDLKAIILNKNDVTGQPSFVNPLWLNQLMEQLLLLDEDDFAKTTLYRGEGDERLHQLMMDVVKSYPADSWGGYAAVFARTHESLGRLSDITWVPEMLEYLALSRFGLREEDLRLLLNQKSDFTAQFAIVRRYLRSHLVQRGELGLWFFAHRQAREKVLSTLSTTRRRWLYNQVLTHFEKSITWNELAKREIMFYYYCMKDYEGAAAYLLQLEHASPESEYATANIHDIYFLSSTEGDTLLIWLGEMMERIIQLQDEIFNSFDPEIQEREAFDEEEGTEWGYWVRQKRKNTYLTSRGSITIIFTNFMNAVINQGATKHIMALYKIHERYVGHSLIEEDYLKGDDTLSSIEIRVLQALKLAESGNTHGAISVFELLLEETDNIGLFQEYIAFVLVRVRYAVLLFQYNLDLNKSSDLLMVAIEELRKLDEQNGERGMTFYGKLIVESNFYLGEILTQQGNYRQAHSHFQESLRIAEDIQYENLGTVLSSLGRLLLIVGQLDEAKSYLQRSITWNKEKIIREPESHETRYNTSNQYFLLGMLTSKQNALTESLAAFEEGQKRVREALRVSPHHPMYQERSEIIEFHLNLTRLKIHLLQLNEVDEFAATQMKKIQDETSRNPPYNDEAATSLYWFNAVLEQQQKWEISGFCLFWCVYFYNQSFKAKQPGTLKLKDAAMAAARLIKMDLHFGSPQEVAEHIQLAEQWNQYLLQQYPNDEQVLTSNFLVCLYTGEYFAMLGQMLDSRHAFSNAKEILSRLIQQNPQEMNFYQTLQLVERKLNEIR